MLISAKLAPCFPYEELEAFWRACDELDFHAVWNYDHFYGLADPAQETLEGWTTLAAMATIVNRSRVGCMVSGVTYRHPAVLANMAVAVDHISGGRLEFGLGAAWHELEHSAYGIAFPSAAERIDRMGEALEIIKLLWTEDSSTFDGRKKTLRVVARHADEWNTPGQDPPEWAELNSVLDDHCRDVGRDPKEVRRSVQMFIHPAQEGQPEEQIEKLEAYEQAGCEHVVFSFYQPPSRGLLEKIAP